MRTIRSLATALALAGFGPLLAAPAAAQVVPFDATLYGNLAAAWQQYVFSIPVPANPTFDTTGVNALVGQSGPLYFLCGAPTTDAITRNVRLPLGKFLFFPLVTVECSTVESFPFFGSNFAELLACATSFFNPSDQLSCTIDGVDVRRLKSYRAASPLYPFTMPPQNNILGLPGVTGGFSVTDGYWLLLEPLAPGNHVIHFTALITQGLGAGFSQNITYNLTVQ